MNYLLDTNIVLIYTQLCNQDLQQETWVKMTCGLQPLQVSTISHYSRLTKTFATLIMSFSG